MLNPCPKHSHAYQYYAMPLRDRDLTFRYSYVDLSHVDFGPGHEVETLAMRTNVALGTIASFCRVEPIIALKAPVEKHLFISESGCGCGRRRCRFVN